MKYAAFGYTFTPEQRVTMRQTISRAIMSGQASALGLTPEIVYNTFPQKGGLHGLRREEFVNFQRYREAKQAQEQGQFFTPPAVCEAIAALLGVTETMAVADLTCGMGHFFNFCPVESNCVGVEIDHEAAAVASYLYPAATIRRADLRGVTLEQLVDIVFGNPPFNLRWGEESSQMVYLRKAADALKPGGRLALIIPAAFLVDDFQDAAQIEEVNDRFACLGWTPLARHLDGFGDIDVKLMVFQKRADCLPYTPYAATQPALTWPELTQRVADATRIAARAWAKLYLENAQARSAEMRDFNERVARLRCDIARHARLRSRLPEADALILRLRTQRQPENMSWAEWEKAMYRPDQLLRDLRGIVRSQHPQKSKAGRVVKQKYHLEQHGERVPIATLLHEGWQAWLDADLPQARDMARFLRRKQRRLQQQITPFEELPENTDIQAYVQQWRVMERQPGGLFAKEIRLTPIQQRDVAALCQKDAALIQWEQGAGKTLALLCWNQWQRRRHPALRYTIITSSALAIESTWQPTLSAYGIAWRRVTCPADLAAAQPGEYLLLTFDVLGRRAQPKLHHALKRWIREHGEQHLSWLCDESQYLCTIDSFRTMFTVAALRRVAYKCFATGTSMLNHPTELFPQLEALLNNSAAMTCWAAQCYQRKDETMMAQVNPFCGQPYPVFRAGQRLFAACHSPERVTVFGVTAGTQDLLQLDALTRLTRSCILTRTFAEVRGRDMLTFRMYAVEPNAHEAALMVTIMEDLHGLLHYFQATGNARKDAGLRLIRQILLLIRACSTPHLFREYTGDGLPTKMTAILDILATLHEPVLLGVTMKRALPLYANAIAARFPARPCFVVSGDDAVSKRMAVAAQVQRSADGILIATQQSMAESINIPEVNQCILESLQWNMSRISQFCSRIRRFNSTHDTTVHCVTYADSIEQNRLGMLTAKQALTDAVRYGKAVRHEHVLRAYGLSDEVLDQCLRKTRAKCADGHDRTILSFGKWGKQLIN